MEDTKDKERFGTVGFPARAPVERNKLDHETSYERTIQNDPCFLYAPTPKSTEHSTHKVLNQLMNFLHAKKSINLVRETNLPNTGGLVASVVIVNFLPLSNSSSLT